MPTVSAGQSTQIQLAGTSAVWVKSTGVGFAEFECGGFKQIQLTNEYQRLGYLGNDTCIELRSVSGVLEYSTTAPAIYPLTSRAMGDRADSSPVDIAQTVNQLVGVAQLTIEQFGGRSSETPDGSFDNYQAISLAVAAAMESGATISGLGKGFYPVSQTIIVTGDVGFLNVKISAMDDFIGSDVVQFGTLSDPIATAGGITNFTVDTRGIENLNGVNFVNFRRVSVLNLEIENNMGIGLNVGAEGYEVYFSNVNVSGPVPPAAPAPDTSIAVRVSGSDCSFVNLAGSRNAIGLDLIGSGNKFSMTHFWGTYFSPGHCKMRVCYHIKGQHNILSGVTIDSPARLNWANPTSLANGGYGVLIDTNAIDTTLINPYLFLSSAGNSLPTSQSIIPVYTDRSRVKLVNPTARNDTGVADAVQTFFQASSSAVLRQSTVLGVTQGGANMPENLYITDSFSQYTPDLKIGGASTGITYSNRRAMIKRVGSLCFVNINVNLTSKGALTGSLTFDIAFPNVNEYADYKVIFNGLIETQVGTLPVVGVLLNNSTSIALRNPETNAAITDAAITNTSRITISGSFLTSTV